jgi:prepilin-type N-terminal cleavage/methylation domain-containing protein
MDKRGFTLIELLVVVAIVAVLAAVVVLTLNPAGMLQEARDSGRLSDMATLQSAVSLSLADSPSESLGAPSVLYVSVPDGVATSSAGDQC